MSTTFVPKINEKLVRQTMTAIADDLEAWNQAHYVRDNEDGVRQYCFAGRALLLQGYTFRWYLETLRFVDSCDTLIVNPMEEAMAELGFTELQAVDVFMWQPDTDLPLEEQFAAFAEFVFEKTGIDCR